LDYTPEEEEKVASGAAAATAGLSQTYSASTVATEPLMSEDYSRIIDELRSHRREIEKLHMDFNNSVGSAGGGVAGGRTSSAAPHSGPGGGGGLACASFSFVVLFFSNPLDFPSTI
jgi:hypothetical protein